MALPKAHHIETLNEFNSLKFSYDSTNTHYFTGGTDTIVEGTPDILYTDIAYIKPLSCIYTHAKIYPCPVLEYDNEPTIGSNKLVTSGGIKAAIDTAQSTSLFYYATSTSTASERNKVVRIPEITELKKGLVIIVEPNFTSDNIDLGFIVLNDFRPYPVIHNNIQGITDTIWHKNMYSMFLFTGDNWKFIGISSQINTLTFDDVPTANSNNPVKSDGVKTAIDIAPRFYLGTCSTKGNVAIKQVDIPNFPTQLVNGVETPIVGSVIAVKFSYYDALTSTQKTIKVNNTSAYPVWYDTQERTLTGYSGTIFGVANRYIYYVFNGTHWVWVSHGIDNNNTYTPESLGFGYASCTTAAATAAKTATLSNYSLINGGLVVVYFQYDVPAQSTLNINNAGAKEIHFQGSRIAANVIKAGDKCLFIYNGNYMLIAIDRWGKELQEKVSGINISETDFEALSTYEQGKLYFVYDNNS